MLLVLIPRPFPLCPSIPCCFLCRGAAVSLHCVSCCRTLSFFSFSLSLMSVLETLSNVCCFSSCLKQCRAGCWYKLGSIHRDCTHRFYGDHTHINRLSSIPSSPCRRSIFSYRSRRHLSGNPGPLQVMRAFKCIRLSVNFFGFALAVPSVCVLIINLTLSCQAWSAHGCNDHRSTDWANALPWGQDSCWCRRCVF